MFVNKSKDNDEHFVHIVAMHCHEVRRMARDLFGCESDSVRVE